MHFFTQPTTKSNIISLTHHHISRQFLYSNNTPEICLPLIFLWGISATTVTYFLFENFTKKKRGGKYFNGAYAYFECAVSDNIHIFSNDCQGSFSFYVKLFPILLLATWPLVWGIAFHISQTVYLSKKWIRRKKEYSKTKIWILENWTEDTQPDIISKELFIARVISKIGN